MRAPDFWWRDDGGGLAASLLAPAGWGYGAITDWKRLHASPYRPRAKVICIGNLTAGGSGKTPVALAVARILRAQNRRVIFLTRGYGGRLAGPVVVDPQSHNAGDVGDESLLLAQSGPILVARNRAKGAALADAENADIILMDDGYQNFSIAKDLAILVVDAETAFGNGHLIPAGPLREQVRSGLARADAVVLVGQGSPALPGFSGPLFRARLVPEGWVDREHRIVAFAGIGRPEKFFGSLKTLGADLAGTIGFADHHRYRSNEIARLRALAKKEDAVLMTTEKDFIRLAPRDREGIHVLAVRVEFEALGDLENLLQSRLGAGDA